MGWRRRRRSRSVPSDFGEFGGHLFVPDPGFADPDTQIMAGNSKVWRIPPEGGPPTLFATLAEGLGLGFRGGLFLPPDFGEFGGQYITAGVREITAYDAAGHDTPFVTALDVFIDDRVFQRLTTPIMAPAGFGDWAGMLLVSYQIENATDPGGVLAITPTARVSHLVTPSVADFFDPAFQDNIFEPYGLVFTPADFGDFGGMLLVSNAQSHNIAAVAADGSYRSFTHVPLQPGQEFLRQMAISPAGFGNLGGLLFVSVAGSKQGGGELGAIHAIAPDGQVVASLRAGDGIGRMDPRGLLFTGDGRLLISDATARCWRPLPAIFAFSCRCVREMRTGTWILINWIWCRWRCVASIERARARHGGTAIGTDARRNPERPPVRRRPLRSARHRCRAVGQYLPRRPLCRAVAAVPDGRRSRHPRARDR